MSCSKNLNFFLGEKRYIQFKIISKKAQPIFITNATYVLTHNHEVIDSGACEVVENETMQVLVTASEIGQLQLEISYTIAPEERKVRCCINVS